MKIACIARLLLSTSKVLVLVWGGEALEIPPAQRLCFFQWFGHCTDKNVNKTHESNAFQEPTCLPWETKPIITFLNCYVLPKMLLYLKRIHSKMSATVDRGQLMESSKRRQKFAKRKSSKRLLTKCHLAIIYLLPAANWFL